MSNKLSAVMVLCMSTMCLSGCDLLRVAGPCYGVGCPAGTAGGSGQYKPGEAPKAQNASAPAPTKSAAAPIQNATAQPNGVQPDASAQPAPTQDANAEAKPSPFHAIGEFFERLIPHHNSGANSGASN
jgi:hypothetical protein